MRETEAPQDGMVECASCPPPLATQTSVPHTAACIAHLSIGEDEPPVEREPLQVLASQVGGHKSSGLPMLQSSEGYVFKPLQTRGRGEKEADFYKLLFHETVQAGPDGVDLLSAFETLSTSDDASSSSSSYTLSSTSSSTASVTAEEWDTALRWTKEIVPFFHGVVEYQQALYLKLEDLTRRFRRPCIMDIKIGTRTYDELATPEKIERERTKYPPQERLGFRIVGMRVHERKSDTFRTYPRTYGRSLDEATVGTGFEAFLSGGGDPDQCEASGTVLRRDVVPALLSRLGNLLAWAQQQRVFRFYSSSVLLIYEGAPLSVGPTCDLPPSAVEARAIDFAHVFPQLDNGHCDGYALGIRAIMDHLKAFL